MGTRWLPDGWILAKFLSFFCYEPSSVPSFVPYEFKRSLGQARSRSRDGPAGAAQVRSKGSFQRFFTVCGKQKNQTLFMNGLTIKLMVPDFPELGRTWSQSPPLDRLGQRSKKEQQQQSQPKAEPQPKAEKSQDWWIVKGWGNCAGLGADWTCDTEKSLIFYAVVATRCISLYLLFLIRSLESKELC